MSLYIHSIITYGNIFWIVSFLKSIKHLWMTLFFFYLFLHVCLFSAVADLQRMFPTPPSLEQHPAFSPITPYRDTPSQEPPAPSGVTDHLPSLASTQFTEYRMEMEEVMASPRQDDVKVSWSCSYQHPNFFHYRKCGYCIFKLMNLTEPGCCYYHSLEY